MFHVLPWTNPWTLSIALQGARLIHTIIRLPCYKARVLVYRYPIIHPHMQRRSASRSSNGRRAACAPLRDYSPTDIIQNELVVPDQLIARSCTDGLAALTDFTNQIVH